MLIWPNVRLAVRLWNGSERGARISSGTKAEQMLSCQSLRVANRCGVVCNHMSVGGLPISADTGRTSSPRIAACLAETADVARVVGLRCSFLLARVCVRRVLFAIGRPGRT